MILKQNEYDPLLGLGELRYLFHPIINAHPLHLGLAHKVCLLLKTLPLPQRIVPLVRIISLPLIIVSPSYSDRYTSILKVFNAIIFEVDCSTSNVLIPVHPLSRQHVSIVSKLEHQAVIAVKLGPEILLNVMVLPRPVQIFESLDVLLD